MLNNVLVTMYGVPPTKVEEFFPFHQTVPELQANALGIYGNASIVGRPVSRSWTELAKHLMAGDNTITLR